nr:TIM barrel protein [Agreia bicolorata]
MTGYPWSTVQANISLLFNEVPFLDRPAAARAAGFQAIECWWPFATAVPTNEELAAFVGSIEDAGVHLRALNFFAGNMAAGERGILSDPSRLREFRDNVDVVADLGARLKIESFNALYGNRIEGLDPAKQDDSAIEAITFAADAVSEIGATVLLEPVSGVDAYPLKTAADVVRVLAEVPHLSNVRLLADLYHLTVNGDDVEAVAREHMSVIGHVQIADAPGRHEPGSGDMDIPGLVEVFVQHGYKGRVGLEYVPSAGTRESLEWLRSLSPFFGSDAHDAVRTN